MSRCSKLLILGFFFAVCVGSAFIQQYQLRQQAMLRPTELFDVVTKQISAIREDNYAEAYRQISNGFQEKFDIAQQRCMSMDQAADQQIALNNEYQTSMRDLIRQKGQVDRRINNLSDLNSKAEGIVGGLVVSIATGNVPGMILGGLKLLGAGAENRYKDKAIRLGEEESAMQSSMDNSWQLLESRFRLSERQSATILSSNTKGEKGGDQTLTSIM